MFRPRWHVCRLVGEVPGRGRLRCPQYEPVYVPVIRFFEKNGTPRLVQGCLICYVRTSVSFRFRSSEFPVKEFGWNPKCLIYTNPTLLNNRVVFT